MLAGVYLIATAGWELLLVGAASILAGVLYTGGPRPYGYEGLGEVFVFLFFGVVAVAGSYFAQVERLEWEALVLAVPVGLLASAILVVNNVRDLETDRRAGKRTLAVRLGRDRARALFVAMVVLRVRDRAAAVDPRLAVAVAVPLVAGDPARDPAGRDRADADRRPVAQRRAGRDRAPAARVLRAALRGAARELVGLMATLAVTPVRLPLRAPLVTAWGELRERDLLQVRLAFGDGDEGHGEAAPLEPYDGVSLGVVAAALDAYAAVLRDAGPDDDHDALLAACAAERDVPAALAAIDLALWDRAGRRAGRPVAHLLVAGRGGGGAGQRDDRRHGPGGRGRGGGGGGAGRVRLREGQGGRRRRRGPDRRGARGGRAGARDPRRRERRVVDGARGAREPARAGARGPRVRGGAGPRRRRAAPRCAPPASARWRWTRRRSPGAGVTDAVCLKVSRSGGITGLLRDARLARAAGSDVYVASAFDGPLGIAAGVHAAAALAAGGPLPWCGLATLGGVRGPAARAARGGAARSPCRAGPGLLG